MCVVWYVECDVRCVGCGVCVLCGTGSVMYDVLGEVCVVWYGECDVRCVGCGVCCVVRRV